MAILHWKSSSDSDSHTMLGLRGAKLQPAHPFVEMPMGSPRNIAGLIMTALVAIAAASLENTFSQQSLRPEVPHRDPSHRNSARSSQSRCLRDSFASKTTHSINLSDASPLPSYRPIDRTTEAFEQLR